MSCELDRVLDEALSLIESGVSLEGCLARYPEHTAELAPLLRTAIATARTLEQEEAPSAAAMAAGRHRLLHAASRPAPAPGMVRRIFRSGLRPALRPLATCLVAVALVILVGGMVGPGVAGSLPGDVLYPVKRAVERVRLSVTWDAAARQQLQQAWNQERILEIQAVSTMGRVVAVEFLGIVEAIGASEWMIGTLPVSITPTTRVEGQPTVGAIARVKADVQASGRIEAREIVMVIDPVVPDSTATPNLTMPPLPIESAIPAPTSTPSLTPTGTHPPTSSPTPTKTGTHTPTVTPTPIPTQTPAGRPTPLPPTRVSPSPTTSPQPTESDDDDDETPQPSDTPEPTNTPTATEEPEPTDAPTATEEPESINPPDNVVPPQPADLPEGVLEATAGLHGIPAPGGRGLAAMAWLSVRYLEAIVTPLCSRCWMAVQGAAIPSVPNVVMPSAATTSGQPTVPTPPARQAVEPTFF